MLFRLFSSKNKIRCRRTSLSFRERGNKVTGSVLVNHRYLRCECTASCTRANKKTLRYLRQAEAIVLLVAAWVGRLPASLPPPDRCLRRRRLRAINRLKPVTISGVLTQ